MTTLIAIALFLVLLDRQRSAHQAELARKDTVIDRLVERVQHPEVVLPDMEAKPVDPSSLYVSSFDDEGFNALKDA